MPRRWGGTEESLAGGPDFRSGRKLPAARPREAEQAAAPVVFDQVRDRVMPSPWVVHEAGLEWKAAMWTSR